MPHELNHDQVKLALTLSALPGVTPNEVREAAGLPPREDLEDLILNLPAPTEENEA